MASVYKVNKYIYSGIYNEFHDIQGPRLKWNQSTKLYEYLNTLLPNKVYIQTFDPKFMKRGDILKCGKDKHTKLVYNGEKLLLPYYDIEDDGSIPYEYVVGDKENEFDIGYFEKAIESKINWLSNDKLKEIELFIKNDKIEGKVIIKNKEWKIKVLTQLRNLSHFDKPHYDSNHFDCNIKEGKVYIDIIREWKLYSKTYLVKAINNEDQYKLFGLVEANNYVSFINYFELSKTPSISMIGKWFAYHSVKSYKLNCNYDDNNIYITELPNFPIIWKKYTKSDNRKVLIFNEEDYIKYLSYDKSELNEVYIEEITGCPINAELLIKDNDTLINEIQEFIKYTIDTEGAIIPFYYEIEDILRLEF
jgi:hypothetical protein